MATELERLQEAEVELAKINEQIKVLKKKQEFAINRAGTQNRFLTSINQLSIKRDNILALKKNQLLKVDIETLTAQRDSLIKQSEKNEADFTELKTVHDYLIKTYPELFN